MACLQGPVGASIDQGGHGRKKKFMGMGEMHFTTLAFSVAVNELLSFDDGEGRFLHAYPLGRWWLLGLVVLGRAMAWMGMMQPRTRFLV